MESRSDQDGVLSGRWAGIASITDLCDDLIVNLWMATTTIYRQVTRLQSGGLITVAIQME